MDTLEGAFIRLGGGEKRDEDQYSKEAIEKVDRKLLDAWGRQHLLGLYTSLRSHRQYRIP